MYIDCVCVSLYSSLKVSFAYAKRGSLSINTLYHQSYIVSLVSVSCGIIIIIIMLHLHGIDATTGQLSNLCLPSNHFPRSRIGGISDSLSISRSAFFVFVLYFISSTFRIIRAVPRRHVFCNISTSRFRSSLPIFFLKFFVTVPKAPLIIGKIMTLSTSLLQHFRISYFKSV